MASHVIDITHTTHPPAISPLPPHSHTHTSTFRKIEKRERRERGGEKEEEGEGKGRERRRSPAPTGGQRRRRAAAPPCPHLARVRGEKPQPSSSLSSSHGGARRSIYALKPSQAELLHMEHPHGMVSTSLKPNIISPNLSWPCP